METVIIETGIARGNCKDWDVPRALAEFLQNALDERDQGADMVIEHDGTFATIADDGKGIELRHLAIGETDKSETDRGHFGEGFKVALLVLEREGRLVSISSNGREISPEFRPHPIMGISTLVFVITECAHRRGTVVTVECTPEELRLAKSRFLDFQAGQMVSPGIFLPDASARDIYVNGVRVASLDKAIYSYNLRGEEAQAIHNRDRTALDKDAAAPLIAPLLVDVPLEVAKSILQNLTGSWEGDNVSPSFKLATVWLSAWQALWGKKAIIASWNDNLDRLRYMGYEPVQVPYRWTYALGRVGIKTAGAVREDAAKEERKAIELTRRQGAVLAHAQKWLLDRSVNALVGYTVQVARGLALNGEPCLGLYASDGIWLDVSTLRHYRDAVTMLVHELAHGESGEGDCSAGFESRLGKTWEQIAFAKTSRKGGKVL